jgi:hypothetical protein
VWYCPFLFSDNVNAADMFRVYSLPKLFYELRNACVPDKPGAVGFPAFSLAECELDRDVFNFTKGISCEVSEFVYILHYSNMHL